MKLLADWKSKKGFSLTEVVIVLGIFMIIAGSSFPLMMNFYKSKQIKSVSEGLVQAFRKAQMKAITGEEDSAFGVKISESQYTVFKGSAYSDRDQAFDEIAGFPQDLLVEFSESDLSEIYFSRIRGIPSVTGTIDLSVGNKTERITINDIGRINFGRVETTGSALPETTELLTSASQSSWTSSYAPYRTYYEDSIAQSIYLKSDLEETGISGPVEITEVCLYCSETPGRDIANMRIKMKNTAASSLSSFDTSGLTVVYGPASYVKPAAGEWKCHTLDTPFTWDGTSNLLVESYRNDDDWTSGGGNYVRNTGSGRTYAGYCDSCSGCGPGQDCYSPSQRRSFSYVMSIKLTYIPQD
ncbi:MAG: prepilin-type N-terminal cleavage/methylation domain-containing protein [Candidatus Pacebacteria bacterium]|nr:prepilin-type N-terminal cleavage/methylation domain-containing protein [Candidatus Paceibacterota bacterium]